MQLNLKQMEDISIPMTDRARDIQEFNKRMTFLASLMTLAAPLTAIAAPLTAEEKALQFNQKVNHITLEQKFCILSMRDICVLRHKCNVV